MNNLNEYNTESTKKRSGVKTKVLILIILLLVGAGAYFYFWFTNTNALRQKSLTVIKQAKMYETLNMAIVAEKKRCTEFIAQKQGNFGNFEYCKSFIEWADTINQSL